MDENVWSDDLDVFFFVGGGGAHIPGTPLLFSVLLKMKFRISLIDRTEVLSHLRNGYKIK